MVIAAAQIANIFLAGRAWTYKLLPNGGRQIINFPIPGDCVGLRSVLLRTSDHSLPALTYAVVSGIQASRMMHIFNEYPHEVLNRNQARNNSQSEIPKSILQLATEISSIMESENTAFQTKFLPVARSMHYELTERLGNMNRNVSANQPEIKNLMQIMAVELIETGTIAGAHPIANLANYLQDLATRLP